MGAVLQEAKESKQSEVVAPTLPRPDVLPRLASQVRLEKILSNLIHNPLSVELIPDSEVDSSSFLKGLKGVQLPREIIDKFANLTPDQAISSLIENPFAYFALSKEFKNDPSFCLSAMKAGAEIYLFLPTEMQVRSKFVIIEAAKDGFNLRSLGQELLDDVSSLKKILEVVPALFSELPQDLRSNREIIFQILDRSPGLVNAIPEDLLAEKDIQIFIAERSLASELVLDRVCPDHVCSEARAFYAKHKQALNLLNIKEESAGYVLPGSGGSIESKLFFHCKGIIAGRYVGASEEIRSNLDKIYGQGYFKDSKKEDILFVSADTTEKPASLVNYKDISVVDECLRNYNVRYFDVDSKEKFANAVLGNTENKLNQNMVFFGHGNQTSLVLSGKEGDIEAMQGESTRFNTSDRTFQRALSGKFEAGHKIYLIACETGKGQMSENETDNMAKVIFGCAPESTVLAPKLAITEVDLLDPDGFLTESKFVDFDTKVGMLKIDPIKTVPVAELQKIFSASETSLTKICRLNEPGILVGRRVGDKENVLKLFYFGKTVAELNIDNPEIANVNYFTPYLDRELAREILNKFLMANYPAGGDISMENIEKNKLKELEVELSNRLEKPIAIVALSYDRFLGLNFDFKQVEMPRTRIAEGSENSTH